MGNFYAARKKGKGRRPKRKGAKKKGQGASNVGNTLADRMGPMLSDAVGQQNGTGLRGPPDDEREFPHWSAEQIARFLEDSEWDSSSSSDTEGEDTNQLDLQADESEDNDNEPQQCEMPEMPEPKPLDSVFGAAGAGTGASQQTGLLGSLLDPDAGGKGRNKDGLMGFLASQGTSRHHARDKRARLRAKLRYMRRNRGAKSVVRDDRGRKVRGSMQMTAEDIEFGGKVGRNVMFDKQKSKTQRNQMVKKLRAEAAERKAQANSEAQSEAENDMKITATAVMSQKIDVYRPEITELELKEST